MATDEQPFEAVSAYAEQAAQQTMDVVHAALSSYFGWLRKMQTASPLGDTDLNRTLLKYAEDNVNAVFTFAQELSQAKSLQDVIKLQIELAQKQFQASSAQVKDLGAAFTEAAKAHGTDVQES